MFSGQETSLLYLFVTNQIEKKEQERFLNLLGNKAKKVALCIINKQFSDSSEESIMAHSILIRSKNL